MLLAPPAMPPAQSMPWTVPVNMQFPITLLILLVFPAIPPAECSLLWTVPVTVQYVMDPLFLPAIPPAFEPQIAFPSGIVILMFLATAP